jgi:CRP-like cAMP-binding protein
MLETGRIEAYLCGITGTARLGRQWLRDASALPPLRQESAMPRTSNLFLASLSAADYEVVRPHLKSADLPQGGVLFEMGAPIHQVYFPHSGIVSLVVDLASGDTIESAMIGRESVVGASSGLNGQLSVCKAIVQIAGTATTLDALRLRALAETSIACRTMLFRHEQLILVQAQQSAACNASHTIEARLARWLLRSRDLQGSDDLLLTQEFISEMLGVRRTSVSVVANTLQQAGFLRYRRGHIRILNLEGLQETACECYQTVKAQSERLLKEM